MAPSPSGGKKKKENLISKKETLRTKQSGKSLLPGMIRNAMGVIIDMHSGTTF
jgi:hypothetical protein